VKSKFATFLLAAALVLACHNGLAAGSDVSANLRLSAFGGDAQLKAVTNAVARFNQKYPNVKVEISIDPISNGWGDYVTRILSQFNANNAYDVYGTAIETFRTFETRNLFIPLDDYIASHASYSDFDPALFQVRVIQGQDLLHPDWVEQYHGESYL
jgi:multiple sugar transport system substrate-binding protein